MSDAANRKTLAAYFAAIRALDADAWLRTFAPDGESHDPVGAPVHRGPAALRQFFNAVGGAFAKVDISEDHVFFSGGGAAVKWTIRGVARSGKNVMAEGIDVFEFDGQGQIKRVYAYWNPAELMAQLAGDTQAA